MLTGQTHRVAFCQLQYRVSTTLFLLLCSTSSVYTPLPHRVARQQLTSYRTYVSLVCFVVIRIVPPPVAELPTYRLRRTHARKTSLAMAADAELYLR